VCDVGVDINLSLTPKRIKLLFGARVNVARGQLLCILVGGPGPFGTRKISAVSLTTCSLFVLVGSSGLSSRNSHTYMCIDARWSIITFRGQNESRPARVDSGMVTVIPLR